MKKISKLHLFLFFSITVIPYFIIKIPPFTDFIGHLYFAFYSGNANDAYLREFHFSYQFVDSLLSLLKIFLLTPGRTSAVFFTIYSLLFLLVLYLFLKLLNFNFKKFFPFLFLYPIAQFTISYYWGLIPFVFSSLFWTLFVLFYLSRSKESINIFEFILLSVILFLSFFSHPLSFLFIGIVLLVFFLKAVLNREKKNIIYLIFLSVEIIFLSLLFKLSQQSRLGNMDITFFFIGKNFLQTILVRINYAISYLNTNDFTLLSGINGLSVTILSLVKSLSYLSSYILIYFSFKNFSIKSSKFYLILIIFLLNIFYFFITESYDQGSMLPIRVLDYFEIMRFGGLIFLASLFIDKFFKDFSNSILFKLAIMFSFISFLFVKSFLDPAKEINKLVAQTTNEIIRCDKRTKVNNNVIYTYDFTYDLFFKRVIIIAASLSDELKNRKIVIRNEWATACTHCPIIWNQKYDQKKYVYKQLLFNYSKDNINVICQ